MAARLKGTTLEAFWAQLGYQLPVAVVQPIYVTVSDIFGRRVSLFASLILFSIGAVVFAVAKNMGAVIAGRVLMGLGGGGMEVLSEVIVTDMSTLKERPTWGLLLSIPVAIGSILGPIVGALCSGNDSWRWLGWHNLPFVAVTLFCAYFFLKLKPTEESLGDKLRRLDWFGMALFALGAVLSTLSLSWASTIYSWKSWEILVPFLLGIAALIGFAVWEKRPAYPCMPHRIFGNITAQVTLIGSFSQGAVVYAALAYLPVYFQAVPRVTPMLAAILLLPICIAEVVSGGFVTLLVNRTRKYRLVTCVGWGFLAVGMGVTSLWNRNTSLAMMIGSQIITGFGQGTLFISSTMAMQASAPTVDDQGLAAGTLVSFRLFGGLVGTACGATAFSSTYGQSISKVYGLSGAMAFLRDPAKAIEIVSDLKDLALPKELLHQITDAYTASFKTVWLVLAGFAAAGGLASLAMKEPSIESEEVGRQTWEANNE